MPSSSSSEPSTLVLSVGHRLDRSLALQDTDGRPLPAGDLLQGRPLVLYFLRGASCPVCLRHARDIIRQAVLPDGSRPDLAFVVPGGPAQAVRVTRAIGSAVKAVPGVPVRVLSSSEATAHAVVGLGRSWTLQASGTFLIGPDGVVRYARSATLPTGGYDTAELAAALRAISA